MLLCSDNGDIDIRRYSIYDSWLALLTASRRRQLVGIIVEDTGRPRPLSSGHQFRIGNRHRLAAAFRAFAPTLAGELLTHRLGTEHNLVGIGHIHIGYYTRLVTKTVESIGQMPIHVNLKNREGFLKYIFRLVSLITHLESCYSAAVFHFPSDIESGATQTGNTRNRSRETIPRSCPIGCIIGPYVLGNIRIRFLVNIWNWYYWWAAYLGLRLFVSQHTVHGMHIYDHRVYKVFLQK